MDDRTLVKLIVEEINKAVATEETFSAFTITKKLRDAGEVVEHYRVRPIVHESMNVYMILGQLPRYDSEFRPVDGKTAIFYYPVKDDDEDQD
ncbi:MAG TPA: hypothetical protein PKD55_01420 [Bellilinea sp.]|nr:hypothetical protein [Bellilinea sp.]